MINSKILIISGAPIRVIFQNSVTFVLLLGVILHSPNFAMTYTSGFALLYDGSTDIRIVCRSGSTTSNGQWSSPDGNSVPTSGAIRANPISGDVGTSELSIDNNMLDTVSMNIGTYTCRIPDVDGVNQTSTIVIYTLRGKKRCNISTIKLHWVLGPLEMVTNSYLFMILLYTQVLELHYII